MGIAAKRSAPELLVEAITRKIREWSSYGPYKFDEDSDVTRGLRIEVFALTGILEKMQLTTEEVDSIKQEMDRMKLLDLRNNPSFHCLLDRVVERVQEQN